MNDRHNPDGVPILPFSILGFVLGWLLVSAFRNPIKSIVLIVGTFCVYHIMVGIERAQQMDRLADVRATSTVNGAAPAKAEKEPNPLDMVSNTASSSCSYQAPNVGEPFLC